MNRAQITLSITLVLQIVLIATFRSSHAAESRVGQPEALLGQLETIQPSRILLHGSDDETLTLSKDGTEWTLDDADHYPVKGEKVEKLLGDLADIMVRRPVVTNSRYHGSLEVTEEEPRGRVQIFANGSEPDVDLIVGTSSNYRLTHVRRAGEDEVWEVEGVAAFDISPNLGAWIEKKFTSVTLDDVTAISVTNATESFEIEKGDEGWVIVSPDDSGVDLDSTRVDSLVRSMASLNITDPVGRVDEQAHGFSAPAATVVLKTGGEAPSTLEIRVGGLTGENNNKRYITRSGFGFTATVWATTMNRVVEKGLADLAKEEEAVESSQ